MRANHGPDLRFTPLSQPQHHDVHTDRPTVLVVDFGAQYAQLIARRVRELNVYSELLPFDTPLQAMIDRGAKGIILSGGPNSVYDPAGTNCASG